MAKIFFKVFGKTIGIMALLLGVGVASYFLTTLWFKVTTKEERSTQYDHVITVDAGSESSNLIYSVEKDTNAVRAIVLELFDKETGNLDYVTIPNKTQISLDAKVYEEYEKISPAMPQIVTLRDINQYFKGDVAYEYGILLLQEALNVDIGYFTAFDSVEFDKRFEKKDGAFRPNEEYLATILHPYGWYCCWGSTIDAVDFCKEDGSLLQVKTSNNSENSSSIRVRNGTEIRIWFRRFFNKANTFNWVALNEIIGRDIFNEEDSERKFRDFITRTIRENPGCIYIPEKCHIEAVQMELW